MVFCPELAQGSVLQESECNSDKHLQSCGNGRLVRGSGIPSPLWGERETSGAQTCPQPRAEWMENPQGRGVGRTKLAAARLQPCVLWWEYLTP